MKSSGSRSVQLAVDAIRAQMRSGALQPGSLLPPETGLAQSLDLSRGTIRRAIDVLVQSGEVSRKRNARPRVESVSGGAHPPGTEVQVWISHPIADDATLQFLRGISNGLMGSAFKLVVREPSRFFGDLVKEDEREFLKELMRDENVWAGIIERDADARNDDLYRLAVERGKCLVFVDLPPPEGLIADYVGTANVSASRKITEHLIQLGHRRIVYVSESFTPYTVRQRMKGYWRALSLAGLAEHGRTISAAELAPIASAGLSGANPDGLGSARAGGAGMGVTGKGCNSNSLVGSAYYSDRSRRLVREILAMEPNPTAIVASCDVLAMWLSAVLEEQGFRVPGDFAMGGFDWLARWEDPSQDLITTAAQDFEGFGYHAAEFILDRSNEERPSVGRQLLLPAPLQVRSSTVQELTGTLGTSGMVDPKPQPRESRFFRAIRGS